MQNQDDIRREFWLSLNLDLPSLAAVRKAIADDDEPAATRALAAHYRKRETPVVANPVVPASAGQLRRADETMGHTYRLAGCPPYTFDGEIVWNADPFNYNQWPVALNRHVEWRYLAAAYLRTGDEKYAAEWDAQVRHWVSSMPVLIAPNWIQGPFNTAGKTSLSLDAGIRTGQTWFPSFAVFRESPSVTDETIVAFVRSAWEHARYLMRGENFRRHSNWGAMESNGLYHIGVMLPEFRKASLWRETAMQRTMEMIADQVYPDGAQTELAPGYHGVSLRNFLGVMRLANTNQIAVPNDFAQRLEGMFDYYLRIADPAFRTPNLNDSSRGGVTGILREGSELFPQRQDFLWAAENRHAGTETAIPVLGHAMGGLGRVPQRLDARRHLDALRCRPLRDRPTSTRTSSASCSTPTVAASSPNAESTPTTPASGGATASAREDTVPCASTTKTRTAGATGPSIGPPNPTPTASSTAPSQPMPATPTSRDTAIPPTDP